MSTISLDEYLTASELLALNEMFGNGALMDALGKIFHHDSRVHAESLKNEALAGEPNAFRMAQAAARQRAAEEWRSTIERRMKALTLQNARDER